MEIRSRLLIWTCRCGGTDWFYLPGRWPVATDGEERWAGTGDDAGSAGLLQGARQGRSLFFGVLVRPARSWRRRSPPHGCPHRPQRRRRTELSSSMVPVMPIHPITGVPSASPAYRRRRTKYHCITACTSSQVQIDGVHVHLVGGGGPRWSPHNIARQAAGQTHAPSAGAVRCTRRISKLRQNLNVGMRKGRGGGGGGTTTAYGIN